MADRTQIGPKAESLRRLAEAGLPVPEARFLDASSYDDHAWRADVRAMLAGSDTGGLDAAAVRAALHGVAVSDATASEITALHRSLGDGPVAVRSSGSAEDMPESSFAGQHGTYFVTDPAHLVDAVRDCWVSLFGDRAVSYREHAGIPHTGVSMAVIIQRFVPAQCAGVAFTVDPLNGTDRVLVESCFGIGEALVTGRVTPDTFAFERDGLALVDRSTGKKPIRIAVDADGTLRERPLDAATASTPSADEPVAREVARLALQAERLFPGPVDVEWAFDGERVWLLQARPVTTIASGRAAAASDAAPPAVDTAPVVWSNVNTGEILPDVASPMTWSIIHGHAQQVFGGMFDALGVHVDAPRLVGLVGGRIYFNLSLLQESVAHLPQLDVTATLGGMQDYIELPEAAAARRPGLLPALRAGIALPGYVLGHTPRRAERFLARMRAENDRAAAVLAAEPGAPEVAALVHGLLDDFDEFNESLAFMMVAMIGFGALARQCKKWFGDESGALANRLVAGAGGVVSAESGHALWRLAEIARSSPPVCSSLAEGAWTDVRARLEGADGVAAGPAAEFLAAWDAFMTEHGHHRRGELEFANPTWAETPDYVLGVVRGYLARAEGDDPIAEYAARAAEADAAAATCRGRLRDPVRRAVFDRLLRWGRSSAAMRENVKSQDVRWLVAIRLALLALADRLVEDGVLAGREDIFFLTMEEIDPVVAEPQSQDWRAIVAARRAERVRLSKLNPPPVVIGDWDEASPAWDVGSGSRELKGMCVSAGVARGRARVFLTADTDETVLPGEILVAPFTDPGWTPYFVPAAGIVMDMGGLLSHGSIIAREYGIPAVVNVGPATRLISTGQMIEVDGDAGVVRILD